MAKWFPIQLIFDITRDIAIKNKVTVNRGEVGGHNGEPGGKGCQEHV